MKNATIQITYPAEKLDAVRQYMGKKDASLEAEMQEALTRLYEKYVPRDVREFLEARGAAQTDKPRRPRPDTRQASPTEHSTRHTPIPSSASEVATE
jgi:hypothetical protein